jgi:protein-S-isoprenylcysteine O-methyltransferase Ste14
LSSQQAEAGDGVTDLFCTAPQAACLYDFHVQYEAMRHYRWFGQASMSPKTGTDHPEVIAFPPLFFFGCATASALLQHFFPLPIMRCSASLSIGLVLAAGSGALALWARSVMKAGGTNIRPDRPALKIVTTGPFRFTRNPLYLSLCLLQLALGFFLNDWIPILFAIPLALMFHFGVVLREESYLESKFGEEYLSFKRQVRRWL